MVNVTRRVVSWLCLLRVRLGFVLGKEFFGSGRLWHAAVIWMGPPSSVAGNFICTAVILRGEAFQRLGQEVRALMNGSMLHGSGEVTFAGGCSKWKDAQPDLCTSFFFSCFPSHTLSLSAYRWCNKKTLTRCELLSLGILISHRTLRNKSALYKFLSHESFVIVAQVTLRQTHDLLAM